MDELEIIQRILEQLGIAGILLWLLLRSNRRYDKLGDKFGARVDALNEKRVEDAKENDRTAAQALEMATRLVEKSTEHTRLTAEAARDLASVAKELKDLLVELRSPAGKPPPEKTEESSP